MLSNQATTSDHSLPEPLDGAGGVALQDPSAPRHPGASDTRRATPRERWAALKIALGSEAPADDEAVSAFIRYAEAHGLDLGEIRIPRHQGPLRAALMPMAASGRTCLILCPSQLGRSVPPTAWREAVMDILLQEQDRGTRVVQVLLEPGTTANEVAGVFAAEGFGELATLRYLVRPARAANPVETLPEGVRLISFDDGTRPLFERAITASYEGSLDCHALHAIRPIEEVIAGHLGAGEFRPEWWQVLVREEPSGEMTPLGVLLLAGIGEQATAGLEVVYLGVSPEMRGRGVGRYLLDVAVAAAAQTRGTSLTLAVDERNDPALALYRSSGFTLLQRRRVLARDLFRQCPLGDVIEPG